MSKRSIRKKRHNILFDLSHLMKFNCTIEEAKISKDFIEKYLKPKEKEDSKS